MNGKLLLHRYCYYETTSARESCERQDRDSAVDGGVREQPPVDAHLFSRPQNISVSLL